MNNTEQVLHCVDSLSDMADMTGMTGMTGMTDMTDMTDHVRQDVVQAWNLLSAVKLKPAKVLSLSTKILPS